MNAAHRPQHMELVGAVEIFGLASVYLASQLSQALEIQNLLLFLPPPPFF